MSMEELIADFNEWHKKRKVDWGKQHYPVTLKEYWEEEANCFKCAFRGLDGFCTGTGNVCKMFKFSADAFECAIEKLERLKREGKIKEC